MADDAAAPPALPPREGATPPELPPREAVESLSLEDDVADLDAAAADEGHEEEAADAAEEIAPPPLTEEEEEARGVAQHLLLNAPPGEFTELLDDVASITPERALEGGFVTGVARARNAQILEAATTEDGARVVLCREADGRAKTQGRADEGRGGGVLSSYPFRAPDGVSCPSTGMHPPSKGYVGVALAATTRRRGLQPGRREGAAATASRDTQ